MKKVLSSAVLAALAAAVPCFAGVTVNSPANGADVSTSFTLSADAATCSSQNVSAMGYSLDNSADTTIIKNTSVNATVSSGTGAHVLHVKAWGNKGASCVTDVAVTVGGGVSASVVPSDAASVSNIESLGSWTSVFDSGSGGGWASGSMSLVGSPSKTGHSRAFTTHFSKSGGVRYSVSFGDDNTSTNFYYDAWVYMGANSSQIGNLEMDMNQTMQNGQTALFGFQCDGYTSTWDYTENAGSPTHPIDKWVHSGAYCNPRGWSVNTWHHVQVYYSRTSAGVITYHTVWLDGNAQNINGTVNSAFALGWAPVLLTNFQVDGLGASGAPTVYLDSLTVYRW